MQIQLLNTSLDDHSHELVVEFSCSVGFGKAFWHGNPPMVHKYYGVEVDIEDQLVLGSNIFILHTPSESINYDDKFVTIRGQLVELFENGHGVVRAQDLFANCVFQEHTVFLKSFVEIRAKRVDIYDMNL